MNFAPDRTIKFMSYAAEEVGLRGSGDIAAQFKNQNQHVMGVLQFDMTNYTKREKEIVLITDYTDLGQNSYMKQLISTYLPEFKVKEERCGYACSDHASWNRHGFPVSFPFETRMDEYNQNIHTENDTLDVSQNNANHTVTYAQLALAYIIEMGL